MNRYLSALAGALAAMASITTPINAQDPVSKPAVGIASKESKFNLEFYAQNYMPYSRNDAAKTLAAQVASRVSKVKMTRLEEVFKDHDVVITPDSYEDLSYDIASNLSKIASQDCVVIWYDAPKAIRSGKYDDLSKLSDRVASQCLALKGREINAIHSSPDAKSDQELVDLVTRYRAKGKKVLIHNMSQAKMFPNVYRDEEGNTGKIGIESFLRSAGIKPLVLLYDDSRGFKNLGIPLESGSENETYVESASQMDVGIIDQGAVYQNR